MTEKTFKTKAFQMLESRIREEAVAEKTTITRQLANPIRQLILETQGKTGLTASRALDAILIAVCAEGLNVKDAVNLRKQAKHASECAGIRVRDHIAARKLEEAINALLRGETPNAGYEAASEIDAGRM